MKASKRKRTETLERSSHGDNRVRRNMTRQSRQQMICHLPERIKNPRLPPSLRKTRDEGNLGRKLRTQASADDECQPFHNDPVGSPLQSPLATEIIKTFKMHLKNTQNAVIVNINYALHGTVPNTHGHQSIALQIHPQKTSSTTEISLRAIQ